MKISGLTVKEATDSIIQKYAGMLRDPQVTLILKEFERPFFIVGGEVVKPGRYDLKGEMTLTHAIAMSGGFNFGANDAKVLLFRRISRDMVETKKINVKHTLEKGKLDEDITLRPGDAVYVAKSWVGKVDQFMKVSRLGMFFNPLSWVTK